MHARFRHVVEARRSEALQGRALAMEAIRLLSGAKATERTRGPCPRM